MQEHTLKESFPTGTALRRALARLSRLNRRKGYGIHSPWAYNLVTQVIYERGAYAVYDELRVRHGRRRQERDDCLMLRLVNDLQPRCALCVGADSVTQDYLRAGSRQCSFIIGGNDTSAWPGGALDLIYIDTTRYETLLQPALSCLSARALLIVRHLRRTKADFHAWKGLIESEKVRVSFDLYDIGLAYTEQRLNKQDYVIYY